LYAFAKCAAIKWLWQNLIVASCGLRGSAAPSISASFAGVLASFAVSIAVWALETNSMGLKTGHQGI
jgi:hypothetical protein